MRNSLLRNFAVALACLASPASAAPIVGIHWGTCPFPQNESGNRNLGSSHQTISVTVRGLSGVVRGFGVGVRLFTQGSGVADAWRFDKGGCNEGQLAYNLVTTSDLCPLLAGPNEQSITGAQYDASLDRYGNLFAREQWFDYRAFDGTVADADRTYTIARFDVELGTSCGCVERPMCIELDHSSYVDGDGVEQPLPADPQFLTWNDPTNSNRCGGTDRCQPYGCGGAYFDTTCAGTPTPASKQSWGRVKASYR